MYLVCLVSLDKFLSYLSLIYLEMKLLHEIREEKSMPAPVKIKLQNIETKTQGLLR